MTKQYNLNLIPHIVDGDVINQRLSDGYINATAMCESVSKRFHDYARLKSTEEFLNELSTETGIPVSALIQTLKGGNEVLNQGTWVHPDVAINLAQWLSAKFAVQVSKWVRDWLSGESKPSTEMPPHIQRYMLNRRKIPHTHFSILNEITFNLIAPLEDAGYPLPEKMVPDISQGIVYSNRLRNDLGVDTSNEEVFPYYNHEYPDGRIVKARLYPIEYLPDFRRHFNEIWLYDYAPKYFKKRDKNALKIISTILLPDKAA